MLVGVVCCCVDVVGCCVLRSLLFCAGVRCGRRLFVLVGCCSLFAVVVIRCALLFVVVSGCWLLLVVVLVRCVGVWCCVLVFVVALLVGVVCCGRSVSVVVRCL